MRAKTVLASVVIVGGLLAAAGGLAYTKYRGMHAGGGAMPEQAQSIQIAVAEMVPFQRSISAVGTIQAVRHVVLTNELAGKVVLVGFESGQVVEEGQVLLKLDTTSEVADLRAAEAGVALAKTTLSRLQTALAGKAVSEQELDRARAELEQALAKVDQLKSMIDKKEIRAAFRGRVGLRDVHPGQYLAEGKSMTTLQGLSDEVHVDFSVPQLQATALGVGSGVFVIVGGVEIPAKVVAFDAAVDLATRNAHVRAAVPSMDGRLTPGMSADVRIPIGEPVQVISVPPTAIRHAPFGDHVFVIEADPKDAEKLRARQRFVRVGGAAGNKVIVADGLKAGERLAGDGSFKLREGALVSSPPTEQPASAPQSAGANAG